MMGREGSDAKLAAALDAYRASAHAEADSHFDERTLELQRSRILQRLESAGQRARVLPFPNAGSAVRPAAGAGRRWISAAAAAGLLVGLLTGQVLHMSPGAPQASRGGASPGAPAADLPGGSEFPVHLDADNALLDAIDVAVTSRGTSELRALDDLTFAYEPR